MISAVSKICSASAAAHPSAAFHHQGLLFCLAFLVAPQVGQQYRTGKEPVESYIYMLVDGQGQTLVVNKMITTPAGQCHHAF
jgi:hypothetical protein